MALWRRAFFERGGHVINFLAESGRDGRTQKETDLIEPKSPIMVIEATASAGGEGEARALETRRSAGALDRDDGWGMRPWTELRMTAGIHVRACRTSSSFKKMGGLVEMNIRPLLSGCMRVNSTRTPPSSLASPACDIQPRISCHRSQLTAASNPPHCANEVTPQKKSLPSQV